MRISGPATPVECSDQGADSEKRAVTALSDLYVASTWLSTSPPRSVSMLFVPPGGLSVSTMAAIIWHARRAIRPPAVHAAPGCNTMAFRKKTS